MTFILHITEQFISAAFNGICKQSTKEQKDANASLSI